MDSAVILDPIDFEAAQPDAADHGVTLVRVASEHGVPLTLVDRLVGPTVTVYRLQPGPGVPLPKVAALAASWSLAVGVPVRYAGAVGHALAVEVPNERRAVVQLGQVLDPDALDPDAPLTVPIGLDTAGNPVTLPLAKLPHMLVAGATGQGKSTYVNALLVSLLSQADESRLRLILIDPKQVELARYAHLSHLALPVATDADAARAAMSWAVEEMERRYTVMREAGLLLTEDPPLLILVDELADLMLDKATRTLIEPMIVRIASKGRAAGVHLVLATQRPSVDVVTGILKANMPTRLAFTVTSQVDSRVVLDRNGAEALVGNGDAMLLPNGSVHTVRVQSPYVTDDEVVRAVAAHYRPLARIVAPAFEVADLAEHLAEHERLVQEAAKQAAAGRTRIMALSSDQPVRVSVVTTIEDELRRELLERSRRTAANLDERVEALENALTTLANMVTDLLEAHHAKP